MSEATLRIDGSLETQSRMGVRSLHNFINCPRLFWRAWVEEDCARGETAKHSILP